MAEQPPEPDPSKIPAKQPNESGAPDGSGAPATGARISQWRMLNSKMPGISIFVFGIALISFVAMLVTLDITFHLSLSAKLAFSFGYAFSVALTFVLLLLRRSALKAKADIADEFLDPESSPAAARRRLMRRLTVVGDFNPADALDHVQIEKIIERITPPKSKPQVEYFDELLRLNLKYYLQTQQQANRSFTLSASAAVGGFLIIAAGVFLLYFNKTKEASITSASGILSEFIAAVFFYLHNQTVIKMAQYHQKLVLSQHLTLALKEAEAMEAPDRQKAKMLLIRSVLQDVNKYIASPVSDFHQEKPKRRRRRRPTRNE